MKKRKTPGPQKRRLMADSQIAEVARRLLLVALNWMVVAGWAGAAGNLAGRDAPAFGDITFFVGSDLHYGYNQHTPACDEISRATLERTADLAHPSWSRVVTNGVVSSDRNLTLVDTSPPSGQAFYRVRVQLPLVASERPKTLKIFHRRQLRPPALNP